MRPKELDDPDRHMRVLLNPERIRRVAETRELLRRIGVRLPPSARPIFGPHPGEHPHA